MNNSYVNLSIVFILAFLVFTPFFVNAQTKNQNNTFKAKVIKVLEEKKFNREDGSVAIQQNLLLKALSGPLKNKEVTSFGIGDFDVVSVGAYNAGDKVYVDVISRENGDEQYFVTDYIRTGWLYLLAVIFVLLTILVSGRKGIKSLLSLILSFVVIIFLIIPQLLADANPLIVAVLGSLLIMVIIIYLTDGFNRKAHLAVLTVFISLILTLLLAYLFTWLTRLSGFSTEEATLLIGTSIGSINFQGLLLAGILIGTVGVLDDIILGQIEAVAQIKLANSSLPSNQVFKMGLKVGQTHLGAIVNTLFLTYVGVSLPLLMLFYLSPTDPVDFFQVINNDAIATEIVRTLVGSIGLMLSMPIATCLASKLLK
ncbi:MAG: YibE/F family protein [Patescibacteria group bacterium]